MAKEQLTQSDKMSIRLQMINLLIRLSSNGAVSSTNPVDIKKIITDAEALELFIIGKQ